MRRRRVRQLIIFYLDHRNRRERARARARLFKREGGRESLAWNFIERTQPQSGAAQAS